MFPSPCPILNFWWKGEGIHPSFSSNKNEIEIFSRNALDIYTYRIERAVVKVHKEKG